MRILGRDMSISTSFELPSIPGGVAASEEFLYNLVSAEVRCLTHDGTEVAKYEDAGQARCLPCARAGWATLLRALR